MDPTDRDLMTALAAATPADRTTLILRLLADHPAQRVTLPGAALDGVDLGGGAVGLGQADLTGAGLRRAKLGGAILERATLPGADLAGADLSAANLAGADLVGSLLEDADLTGASLRFATLAAAVFDGAKLNRADLWGVKAGGGVFAAADLREAVLEEADLTGADLSGADLRGAVLRKCRLHRADLSGADLRDAVLAGADLSGATLRDAKLQDVSLVGCDLTHVHLCDARLDRTRLLREQLAGRVGEEAAREYELARRAYLVLERNFVELGDPDASSWAYRRRRRVTKWESLRQARARWDGGHMVGTAKGLLAFAQDQLVEWVCDYGESVWRALGTLLVVFAVFLAVYWATGAVVRVKGDEREPADRVSEYVLYSMAATTSPGNPPQGLGAADEASYLLTGVHSFAAIFLIGLLGFVAGNRIRR